MYYRFKLRSKIFLVLLSILTFILTISFIVKNYENLQFLVMFFIIIIFVLIYQGLIISSKLTQFNLGFEDCKRNKSKKKLIIDEDYHLGYNFYINKMFNEQNRKK